MTAAEAAPAKRARAENFIVLKDQRVTRVKNECGKPSINERLSDEGKTVTCPTKARPNKIQRRDAINIGSNGPRPKDRGYPYQHVVLGKVRPYSKGNSYLGSEIIPDSCLSSSS